MDSFIEGGSESQGNFLYFHYDEYCDLTGGVLWEQAVDRWLLTGLIPERHHVLDKVRGRYSSPDQFLFEEDLTGQYPLEVLWLKWNIFSDLCRGILSFHRDYRRPHLNIRPSTVFITFPNRLSNFIPARWIYTLDINKSAASPPYSSPEIPADSASRLFTEPQDIRSVYAAPVRREKSFGHEETVTALIRSLERIRESGEDLVRGIIQVHIVSGNIRPGEYTDKDLFRVKLYSPDEKKQPFNMWAGKIVSSEHGLTLKGISDPVTLFEWESIERSSKNVFLNSKLVIYPVYHIPCDLYSLGMMLFRTLLVNDGQDVLAVTQAVSHIGANLEHMAQGIEPDLERNILIRRFSGRLREESRVFSKESVLFPQEKRAEAKGCSYIPDSIWYDALILGFRLITFIPGFSFCSSHGDYDIENPHYQMERVMRVADRVRGLIKTELFGSGRRNREILEICDLARRRLPGREAAPDAG